MLKQSVPVPAEPPSIRPYTMLGPADQDVPFHAVVVTGYVVPEFPSVINEEAFPAPPHPLPQASDMAGVVVKAVPLYV